MLPFDRKKFDECMVSCFQNFRAATEDGLLNEWFDELKGFGMFAVDMAFRKYKREHEKYPPTLAAIIRLAKQSVGEKRTQFRDERQNKCYVDNCFNEDIEECCYNHEVMVCRLHMDEMILKLESHSPRADMIRHYRFCEDERRQLGLTGLQYLKMKNPKLFDSIEKMRESERKEVARKKVVRAVQDFYDTPISPEERKKIVAELRDVAIEGASRVKCAENA